MAARLPTVRGEHGNHREERLPDIAARRPGDRRKMRSRKAMDAAVEPTER